MVPINTERLRPPPPHGLGQGRWSGFLAGTTPAELQPYQESPFQVQGDRPGSRVAELEAAIADRRAEYDASGRIYDEILLKRAEHVARNRDRLRRDVRKAIEKEAAEMRRHVDGLERTRQELLDLRRTEVWVGLFPSELLANERNTQAIAGARKAVQGPLLPGIDSGIIAHALFEFLRADVGFCEDVATLDQYAALTGKTPAQLTGREARWAGDGKVDIVGPSFPATWAGSHEEAETNRQVAAYTEATRQRLEEDGWG